MADEVGADEAGAAGDQKSLHDDGEVYPRTRPASRPNRSRRSGEFAIEGRVVEHPREPPADAGETSDGRA